MVLVYDNLFLGKFKSNTTFSEIRHVSWELIGLTLVIENTQPENS